jgi:hypothetical protein
MSIDYIKQYASGSGGLITISPTFQGSKEVEFYAFLSSFTDNLTSNWNEEQVYGRQDPIGTFQNTTRKISLGFDIPAKNLDEAKANMKNINMVKQFMYPAYSSVPKTASDNKATTNALSLSKSPLVRLQFANLISNSSGKGLLGWIGSFSANPVIDMGMFNDGKKLYPKVYNASLEFTPQHEYDLGYKVSGSTHKAINSKFKQFPYSGV